MTSLLNRIGRSFQNALQKSALHRTREYLLRRDDRFLEDAGFDRELLESGIGAWPWRASESESGQFGVGSRTIASSAVVNSAQHPIEDSRTGVQTVLAEHSNAISDVTSNDVAFEGDAHAKDEDQRRLDAA